MGMYGFVLGGRAFGPIQWLMLAALVLLIWFVGSRRR
jgi:hypothetical protein